MTNKKTFFLTPFVVYIILFLSSALTNPLVPLNITNGIIMALLIFGGSILGYILFFTNKISLDSRTKNTIMTLVLLAIAFVSFYNPFKNSSYVLLGNIIAIPLVILSIIILYLWLKSLNTNIVVIIIFLPSLIQGILMRTSQKMLLFYMNYPNFTTYLVLLFFVVYYGYTYLKKRN